VFTFRYAVATVCDAKSQAVARRCSRCSRRKKKFIAGLRGAATRACNTVKAYIDTRANVRAHPAQSARANRLFRTRGLSGSSGLQDIAAETRKRVNASTLSLASIRLVRHRINGTPQFPSTLSPHPTPPATPAIVAFIRVIRLLKTRLLIDRSSSRSSRNRGFLSQSNVEDLLVFWISSSSSYVSFGLLGSLLISYSLSSKFQFAEANDPRNRREGISNRCVAAVRARSLALQFPRVHICSLMYICARCACRGCTRLYDNVRCVLVFS